MRPARACLTVLLLFCATGSARAQVDTAGYSIQAPKWVAQFTTLSANAVLGGVTAGVIQKLRGGSFEDGFTRGALGGAIVYAGKWTVAQKFSGAGFVGREVGAVGSSVVRNASDRLGTFDRLVLPAGFVRVYWNRKQGDVTAKVDVVAAGYIAYGIFEKGLDFDTRESLSSGTAVFKTQNKVLTYGGDHAHAAGVTETGVVFRSNVAGWGPEFLNRVVRHERVHMVQHDQLYITLNDRLNDWVFSKVRPAQGVARYIELNGTSELMKILSGFIKKHDDRPWELEAIYLTR